MQEKNWMELMSKQTQIKQVLDTVSYTEQFGLSLNEEEAELLAEERVLTLKKERRVEFGEGILPKIIYAFCDSSYLVQDNYCDFLMELQEIFYAYKNEMLDEITDDELLAFMREQFEETCFGDLDYLKGTCLDIFAQAVRAGYTGHRRSGGRHECDRFDIATRWDRELYLETLKELCWR